MVSRHDVERLAQLRSDHGILSAYIKLDPQLAYDRRQAEAKFKGASTRFARGAGRRWRPVLEREKDRVLEHLRGVQPNGRSIVIFSCRPDNIWEAIQLDVMVPTWVTVDTSTHTSILARVLDEYPRLAVAMLDGDNARIYLEEQRRDTRMAEIKSDIPGRHDQGGWSQARYQRHIDFHGAQHRKKVAEELQELYYSRPFDRLITVGVEQASKELEEMLPEPVARRVIGRLPANFKQESDDEILERVSRLREEDERTSEAAMVQQVIESADAGGHGAVGLDETLRAVFEGRVDTLVVAEGVAAEGAACPNCGYFAAERFQNCPACNRPSEPLQDVVEHAVERVYLASGHVDMVFGQAREQLLSRGGVGALLRY
jgi:peptide chain release factor subunit 1